jgi:hypothetical protein
MLTLMLTCIQGRFRVEDRSLTETALEEKADEPHLHTTAHQSPSAPGCDVSATETNHVEALYTKPSAACNAPPMPALHQNKQGLKKKRAAASREKARQESRKVCFLFPEHGMRIHS